MQGVCRREAVTKRSSQCSRAWPHLLDGPYFVVVNQFFEVLVNFSHLHIQLDAGKTFIIFVQRDHARDHAFEMFGVFVSDGLITIDGGKNVVEGIAMFAGQDHQILEITRLHATSSNLCFSSTLPINTSSLMLGLDQS